jgi:hypothetical protein
MLSANRLLIYKRKEICKMKKGNKVNNQLARKIPQDPQIGIKSNIMRSTFTKRILQTLVMLLSLMIVPAYANTHDVTFTMDDLSFSKIDDYDVVLLKDGAYLTDVGKPKLPTKSIRVVIPPTMKIGGITIDKISKSKLEGTFNIYPFQEFKAEFLPPRPFAKPDPAVYELADEYPGKLVISVGESYLCGSYKIAHLLIFPLQYVPKSNELYLYNSVTFTLVLEKGETGVPETGVRSKTSQSSCDHYVRESVINPEDADTYRLSPVIARSQILELEPMLHGKTTVNNGMEPADYIIITSDMRMVDAFMPLAEWRTKKGILTAIFTVPWIESNYNGSDIQEKIKNFIFDCYTNRGIRHVLLGGNADLVPVRYSYIYHYDTFHSGEAATDLYYSNCSIGSEEWGVYEGPKTPTPHVTYNPPVGSSINALLPRVNVGRLLVADENQAADVINKILTYEKNVPAMDYHQTFLYHAADEGGRKFFQDFADSAIPDYLRSYTKTLIADGTDADGQSTPENLIIFMTGGSDLGVPFNFVWSVSHGYAYGLTTNTANFSNYHIDKIINQPRFNGSFYAWACTSAAIGSTYPNVLPAKWVNLPNGGGLAWIGSSITAGGERGSRHALYYHEEMWEESNDYHHHNLGQAFSEAKTRMIENWLDKPIDPATSWCEYHAIIWNLIGDPMVPLFNHMPGTLDAMVYPKMVGLDVATTLSITVEDEGDPIVGALVCLMNSNENVYLTDFTDASGECQFQLPPLSIAGSIDVTVTKHNYRPYEATIQVGGLEVLIDIKPGRYPNIINLKSKRKVPVAILTTDDFDASDVEPETVDFAGDSPIRWRVEDVDNDGDYDMLFYFITQELDLTKENTEAALEGETFYGIQITGTDSVKIVSKCKWNNKKCKWNCKKSKTFKKRNKMHGKMKKKTK